MTPITVKTSAGPVRIGTELGNPAAPVHVVLGQGLMSVSLFLTLEQAAAIESALHTARGDAMHERRRDYEGGPTYDVHFKG
jgi:hypothetical protein